MLVTPPVVVGDAVVVVGATHKHSVQSNTDPPGQVTPPPEVHPQGARGHGPSHGLGVVVGPRVVVAPGVVVGAGVVVGGVVVGGRQALPVPVHVHTFGGPDHTLPPVWQSTCLAVKQLPPGFWQQPKGPNVVVVVPVVVVGPAVVVGAGVDVGGSTEPHCNAIVRHSSVALGRPRGSGQGHAAMQLLVTCTHRKAALDL